MGNERLRKAMEKAHVSLDAVASELGVHEKTVARWLGGRVPHARHRYAFAELVGEPSYVIWPNGDEPLTGTDATDEIVAAWPHRADVPLDRWSTLLAKARTHIDLLGYAIQFLPEQDPRFVHTLIGKAEGGCAIRIALADPTCTHVELRDREEQLDGALAARIRTTLRHLRDAHRHPSVHVHFHTAPMYNSVFRFDEDMLVTPHLYGLPGYGAPSLHLRRLGHDGLFDAFARHFDDLWATTCPAEAS